jgi:hypothetical protein
MGNTESIHKINFEDVQYTLKNNEIYMLINTLDYNNQECLITNTININNEEQIINKFISTGNFKVKIIIYGTNCNDENIYKKYNQLTTLGFYNLFVYVGGMFEWLLLQDIYGEKDFPTTKKELDLLRFKPNKILNIPLLEY